MLRFVLYIALIVVVIVALRRALSKPAPRGRVIDMPSPAEQRRVDTAAFISNSRMDYEIAPAQFSELLRANGDYTVLDVREPWEYETAKIAGAVLMPVGDVPSRAHQELDPEQHIIVYCHHGVRSMNVTAWLRQQGFEKAQSLAGGIDRWSREIDPTVPKY